MPFPAALPLLLLCLASLCLGSPCHAAPRQWVWVRSDLGMHDHLDQANLQRRGPQLR